MKKDEFEAKEQTKKELENQAIIKFLLILNTLLIISFGSFGILASQQGETKTDFRYFNTVRSLETINKVWINSYDGAAYFTKEDYDKAVDHNPKYKKRNIVQKWFKSLSKGS